MKKIVIIFVAFIITIFVAKAVIIRVSENEELRHIDSVIRLAAENTGMESLGLINVTEISRKNGKGYVFDDEAVTSELLHRAGFDESYGSMSTIVGDACGKGFVCKFMVFEPGQENLKSFEKTVVAEYLWGEIF